MTMLAIMIFVIFALPTLVMALGLVVWSNDMVTTQTKLLDKIEELENENRA